MVVLRSLVRVAALATIALALDVVLSPQHVAGDLQALETNAPGRTSYMRAAEADGERVVTGAFTPLADISPVLACGVVAGEDPTFFVQGTLNYTSQRRLLRRLAQGDISAGGSGLAQQLARNLFLTKERSVRRKLREYALAYSITHSLSKTRQLELYLNVVEWGRGIWGVDAASRHYFGVAPADLSPTQSILLATMLPAPRQSMRFATAAASWRRTEGITKSVWRGRQLSDVQRAVTFARLRLWQDAVRRGASAREAWDSTVAVMGPEPVRSDVSPGGPALPLPILCNTARRRG